MEIFDRPFIYLIKDLVLIFGFIKAVIELMVKPLVRWIQNNRQENEYKSHKGILDNLEEIKETQGNMNEKIDELALNQKRDRVLTKGVAKLALASADETREKGATNGKTSKAGDELRTMVMEGFGEGD